MEAATLDSFAKAPIGRYFATGTSAHACLDASLWAVLLWGRPAPEDTAALVRSLAIELNEGVAPHASIVDASRVDSVAVSGFELLDGYVRANEGALEGRVTRLALVRPGGMEGAVVAGFFEVLPRPYPVEVFTDLAAATAWLERDDGDAIATALEAVHEAASGTPPLIAKLRAEIEAAEGSLAIREAAKRLALSDRTLQRRLKALGTNFQEVTGEAKVALAKRLMRDTDDAITTIALRVGCATPQHFSALFRRVTGSTPSDWRKAARG